ncbi:hypothetical protein HJC23_004734 [Cyclotella cryptica]|uniref:Uncharacterized protein n=1 Tax=Cyclotella cryptica TaxID=29204 RepID=A0ABD3NSD7_9STRA|eukprot:CCRYP_020230-RB/>CCRYP_020230-RB protein AED:0.11 eAED:0.11 QI:51/1/1/1/0.5/0.33/3/539/527
MTCSTKFLRLSIILLLGFVALLPFLITIISLDAVPSTTDAEEESINNVTSFHETRKFKQTGDQLFVSGGVHRQEGTEKDSRRCDPGSCPPRRYFATTTNPSNASYYLEPADNTARNGVYADIPSRPWNDLSLIPINYPSDQAASLVRQTIEGRLNALLESDRVPPEETLPKYLPPQFPQWDRSIHRHIVFSSNITGMPPECCPSNIVHQHLTKNFSAENVLSEAELRDCKCRYPRNYPTRNGPTSTLVTAFYQMSSKHPVKMYEKTSTQLLATADPMIIFCQPNSTWVDFFIQNRKHAPTIVVPLDVNELRLVKHFPQATFWKKQYEIDPEASTHHKGVNTMLYVIWDEKLILLHSAAMLNPFNTTQFVWVDTGYWRNPAPHLYRKSAVMINITEEGVKDESTLLFQMIDYNFNREVVISGDQVLVGGNCFAGTYTGISNLYSAFYETFWAMASTGKFVGSDQKVLYRTCHTYPAACHIHKPRKMRSWLAMLGELLPGIGREKIGQPLDMTEFLAAETNLPVPPMGL